MRPLRIAALTCLLLASVLAGCGGPSATPAANTPVGKAATVQPAATVAEKTAAPTNTPQPAAKATTTAPKAATTAPKAATAAANADDSLSLSDRAEGLDKLKSYRMRWQAQWKTTDAGKTESADWDWTEEYTSDPKAQHLIMKTTDASKSTSATAWEMWQIGNMTYMASTDGQGKANCTSFSNDDKTQQTDKGIFNPTMLGSVHDARFVGTETINGVRAKHYRYDQSGASLTGFAKASGDTWVAVDGGYVVKDVLNWEGGAGFLGAAASSKAQGSGQWTWELSDVNKAIAIKPPDNCGGAANDLPLLKDATEKSIFGDSVMYKSATKLADAVAFYEKAMPEAGWHEDGKPQTMEELAMLSFSKAGKKVSIMITVEHDTIQVMLNAGK